MKTRYTRQHDPAMYWFTLGVDAVVLLIATYRVATARWIESPPKKKDLTPDLTPQDWMGNPLKPK